MIYLIAAFSVITLCAILGVLYALRESTRTNRQLADRLMARDLREYAAAKPILDSDGNPAVVVSQSRPERRRREREATVTVSDADVVSAQAALDSLRDT